MVEKFQIETSDHLCDRCEQSVQCGAHYFSAVVLAEEGFARRNFCGTCWGVLEPPGRPPEFYAFWRTRRPEDSSEPPRRLRFDAEVVLDFFRHLEPPRAASPSAGGGEAESGAELYPRQKRDLRFVLALLLLRKKVLQYESSALDEGREWLELSEKDDGERVHWVENPELSDDELERVRDDLGELLHMNI